MDKCCRRTRHRRNKYQAVVVRAAELVVEAAEMVVAAVVRAQAAAALAGSFAASVRTIPGTIVGVVPCLRHSCRCIPPNQSRPNLRLYKLDRPHSVQAVKAAVAMQLAAVVVSLDQSLQSLRAGLARMRVWCMQGTAVDRASPFRCLVRTNTRSLIQRHPTRSCASPRDRPNEPSATTWSGHSA